MHEGQIIQGVPDCLEAVWYNGATDSKHSKHCKKNQQTSFQQLHLQMFHVNKFKPEVMTIFSLKFLAFDKMLEITM